MDKFKSFLQKKKLDVKFKKAGGGHKLTDAASSHQHKHPRPQKEVVRQSGPDSNVAAAALQRISVGGGGASSQQKPLTRSQQTVKAQARKELEEQERVERQEREQSTSQGPEIPELRSAPMMDDVFFTCELLGSDTALPKAGMVEAVAEFLYEFYEEEPVTAAILMVHTLNRDRERRQRLLDTLFVYMDNLIKDPEEEKFRKIRLSNKAFQDRVVSCRGGVELLKAVGFQESDVSPSPDAPPEPYLFLSPERAREFDFQATKAVLMTTEPVPLKLHRNPRVLVQAVAGSGKELDFRIPPAFFDRTSEEIKKEQEARTAQVEKMLTLRTKEMRDRDEMQKKRKYKYCLIRVKFPNSFILEGTFGVHEPLAELRKFVSSSLVDTMQWCPFRLTTPEGRKFLEEEDDTSFADLGLIPAALLYFKYVGGVTEQLLESGKEVLYLNPFMVNAAEEI